MPEICIKSFAFQYEMRFIKEAKIYDVPTTIYDNIVKEICGENDIANKGCNINCELTFEPSPLIGSYTYLICPFGGHWTKDGKELKCYTTINQILSTLCKSCVQVNHSLHVYWDSQKNLLTFEENYAQN